MKHLDEIKEIRKMYNLMNTFPNDNFPKTLGNEEFSEGVTYMTRDDTNLPYDIIVDCGETYKIYNHPLSLFVVDGDKHYPNTRVIPITIANQPKIVGDDKSINFSPILSFIQENEKLLIDFANMKISGGQFFDQLTPYSQSEFKIVSEDINEANYGPNETGLDVWVYVDDTQSFLYSGHNQSYRMKFQQDKEVSNPRHWMPIRLPDLTIMASEKIPPCKEPQWKVNKVFEWAKLNLNGLMKLKDAAISGKEFHSIMQKVDGVKVEFDHQLTNKKSYAKKIKFEMDFI